MSASITVPSGSSQTVPTDVFTGQDFYVPSYKIKIGGNNQNWIQDVLSVSYTDSLTDIDSCDLTVNNYDPNLIAFANQSTTTSPFKYSDADTFNPWQPIEVWMGYIRNGVDERQKMLTGEIATMAPNFPASGGSTLTVRALNLLHRFRVQQDQSPFVNRKDSEIAEFIVTKIAKQVRQSMSNLNVALDADEIAANKLKELTIPYLAINNQYPINFLLQRSRDIGYELFIEEIPSPTAANTPRNVVVHYRPVAADKATVYQLVWGESLVSFQPTLQMANQVSSLTVRGWDPQGKTKIEKTVNRSEVKGIIQPGDLDLDQTGLSQKAEYVCDHPIQSVAEAKVIGMNRLLRMSQDTVEGRGKTVGLPNLRAGTKVVILGLGKRFSGVYLISTTTHTMGDSGYTTDFTAKMVAKTIGGN